MLFFIGLLLIACVSPLFTTAKLFQMKEWRLDRLREHMRSEGWFFQLFGKVRPLVLLAGMCAWLLMPGYQVMVLRTVIAVLALLTLYQVGSGKQKKPVWTSKALAVMGLGTLGMLPPIFFVPTLFWPLLILAAPFLVFFAWALLLPLDMMLKQRVFAAARAARDAHPDLVVIGITGSAGKSTTKSLLGHILAELGAVATPERVNTEMGVAGWMTKTLSEEHAPKILVVEMGAYRKGEIALLCSIARPSLGVVTMVGTQHVALFGSPKAIIEAKGELVAALPPTGHAFLNGDNDGCREMARRAQCPVTFVGSGRVAQLKAIDVQDEDSLSFTLDGQAFKVALHGKHHVGNVLLAIAVARHLGMADSRIAEVLKTFHPLQHSFSVLQEHGVTVVDDTHNASPMSLKAALDWSANRTERPRVLLSSGLLELGKLERSTMRELGAHARGKVERVIFTAERGKQSFEEGFGSPVELLSSSSAHVTEGSLLLCIGRMPLSLIHMLLP